MKRPKSKALILSIGSILLLVLGGWFWLGGDSRVQYRTVKLERGDILSTVSATGNCNAVVTVQVGSQVSGNIQSLYADFNTEVKKGQLVARIDPATFQARVNQADAALDSAKAAVVSMEAGLEKAAADVAGARANVETAKANVAKANVAVADAKTKLDRRIVLSQQGLLSKDDLDTAQATYDSAVAALDSAKSQVQAAQSTLAAVQAAQQAARTQLAQAQAQAKQAEANLAQARVDLDHTYIRAPVDGVVVARRVDVGQTVAASLQAPTLFEIAQDLTKMQVDTNVDEADIGKVKLGQTANFTVDAYPTKTFDGQVTEIRKAPTSIQNVVTYDVVVAVANPNFKLFPGMTANMRILVEQSDNVLRVPNAALRFRPPELRQNAETVHAASWAQAGPTVWVLGKKGKLQPVHVKLGITDGTFSQLAAGDLQEGEQIIVGALSGEGPSSGAAFSGRRGLRL